MFTDDIYQGLSPDLRSRVEELEKTKLSLQVQVHNLKNRDYDKVTKENEALKKKLQKLESSYQTENLRIKKQQLEMLLKNQVALTHNQSDDSNPEMPESLTDEMDPHLKKAIDDLQATKKTLYSEGIVNENIYLKTQLSTLEEKFGTLKQQNRDLKKENDEMKKIRTREKRAHEKYNLDVKLAEANICLENQVKKLIAEAKEKEKMRKLETQKYEYKITELEMGVRTLQYLNVELEKKSQEKPKEGKKKTGDKKDLKQADENLKLRNQVKFLKESEMNYKYQIKQHDSKVKELEMNIRTLQFLNDELEKKYENYKKIAECNKELIKEVKKLTSKRGGSKDDFLNTFLALKNQNDELKETLLERFEDENLVMEIKRILNESQISFLRNPKSQILAWRSEDIAEAIKLYEISAAAYNFLKNKGFPLPAESLLSKWSEQQQQQIPSTSNSCSMEALTPDEDLLLMDTSLSECIEKQQQVASTSDSNSMALPTTSIEYDTSLAVEDEDTLSVKSLLTEWSEQHQHTASTSNILEASTPADNCVPVDEENDGPSPKIIRLGGVLLESEVKEEKEDVFFGFPQEYIEITQEIKEEPEQCFELKEDVA